MKKVIAVTALVLLIFFSMNFTAFAQEEEAVTAKDTLPKEVTQQLFDNGFSSLSSDELLGIDAGDAFRYILKNLKESFSKPVVTGYIFFVIIIIVALVSGVNGSIIGREFDENFSSVGVLCVCTTATVPIITCLDSLREYISVTTGFIQVFVPSLSAVMIASGQTSTAFGYQGLMIFASEFLSTFLSKFIVTLLFLYFAFALVGRISDEFSSVTFTKTIKSVVLWSLSLIMTVFISLVTIKGIIGAGIDSVALRTGKFFLGSFVPAVGGALAEAASTVSKSIGVIKNTTGVFGIIAAALYFVSPVVTVLAYKLTCDISASAGCMLGSERISGILKDISQVLGLICAVILCYGFVFILSTAVILTVGGGA